MPDVLCTYQKSQWIALAISLPGMTEKDIGVSVSGDMLMLSDEKRQEKEQKEKN